MDAADGDEVTFFKYVRHHLVADYERLGWIAHDSLDGTHHAHYSTLMEWPGGKTLPDTS